MNSEDANIRAERAKQLLEDELFKDSLASNITARINECAAAKDEKSAFLACSRLRATMEAQQAIATHIETAKVVSFNEKKRFGMF